MYLAGLVFNELRSHQRHFFIKLFLSSTELRYKGKVYQFFISDFLLEAKISKEELPDIAAEKENTIIEEIKAKIDSIERFDRGWDNMIMKSEYGKYSLPRVVHVNLVMSKNQLKKKVLAGARLFLRCYFSDSRWVETEKAAKDLLQEIFSEFAHEGKKKELNELFFEKDHWINFQDLKSEYEAKIEDDWSAKSLLIPYLSIETPEIARQAFDYAMVMNRSDRVEKLLQKHPELSQDNSYLHEAISLGNLRLARFLIEKGMPLARVRDRYNFQTGETVQETESPLPALFSMLTDLKAPLTPEQEKEVLTFSEFLIDRDTTLDVQIDTGSSAVDDLSMVEAFYFLDHPILQKIALQMLRHGAKISAKIVHDMKLKLKENKESEFLGTLEDRGLMTGEEKSILLADPTASSSAELCQRTYLANTELEQAFERGKLAISVIPMEDIRQLRQLRKAVKRALQETPDELLRAQYERMQKNYETIRLKHALLRELKTIREELKQAPPDTPSMRVERFYALFNKGLRSAKKLYFSEGGKLYWRDMVKRVLIKAQKVEADKALRDRRILWVHGTKSPTLPGLLRTKALVPLGKLLEQGIAPLAGEIQKGADVGFNKEDISGQMLSSDWDETVKSESIRGHDSLLFDASTRLLVSVLYAKKAAGYKDMTFTPEKAWKKLTAENIEGFLKHGYKAVNGTEIRVAILRLRMTDPEADKKLTDFKKVIEEKLKKGDQKAEEWLQNIYLALTMPIDKLYTAEDLAMVESPYPILFASTTALSEYFSTTHEYTHHGKAELGKDIQLAFTEPEKVEELQKILEPFGVKVYDFETAYYLEMLQMTEGSLLKAGASERLSLFLQQFILPEYARLYPETPVYQSETGEEIAVAQPFYGHGTMTYQEYRKAVEEGDLLPRVYHGPLHATRVALWTQLLGESEKVEEKQKFLLGIGGGAHDWARQHDGKDYWDGESVEKLRNLLLALRYDTQEIEDFVHAIKEKDPKERQFTSLPQRIVHDADCLDYMRCLPNQEGFRKEELALSLEEVFIEEVKEFIKVTEEKKKELEATDDNLYDVLLNLIREQKDDFPHLNKLLSH